MYWFEHRDEDAALGDWAEQDPLGYVDGMNLVRCEQSNSVRMVDSKGTLGEGDAPPPKFIGPNDVGPDMKMTVDTSGPVNIGKVTFPKGSPFSPGGSTPAAPAAPATGTGILACKTGALGYAAIGVGLAIYAKEIAGMWDTVSDSNMEYIRAMGQLGKPLPGYTRQPRH